jgi:hypothetical protein
VIAFLLAQFWKNLWIWFRRLKMITEVKPLIEINQKAISLLYKELGVVDAVRFLTQFTPGYGNYTEEREMIIADKSLDDIVNEIEK